MGEPARGYSWPPFEPGHERTIKHGAKSERRWRPIAEDLAADLRLAAPWTAQPAFAATVASWAMVEAQLVLVGRYLDEHGVIDNQGKPRSTTNYLDRLVVRAGRLRSELGLTPKAWAGLLATLDSVDVNRPGDSLEHLREVGRRILDQQRSLPEGSDE